MTISKARLKAHMLEIFRKIEETGETLVVTDHNRPVLKIIPYRDEQSVAEVFGSYNGKAIYHEDINTPNGSEWELT